MTYRIKCVECREYIAPRRIARAEDRGQTPRFCSEECKNRWHQRERRKAGK